MKILQVLPQLNFGGVETGTVDFSKYLVKHGHKSIVISNGGALVEELTKCGTKHIKLPVHQKNPFLIFLMARKIASIIKEEDIDIVHARSRVPGWIAFFAVKIADRSSNKRIIFITTCHGHYSNKFTSRVMSWGKRVIVASNAIGRHMVDNFNTPQERLKLIPRGVNIEKFSFKQPSSRNKTQFTVGIVGRITPLKGHEYFIKSLSSVIRQIPNIKVLIVGEAPKNKLHYRQELEFLVRRLGLDEHVQFLGKRNDIPEILSKLNLLVVSTIEEEAFGRVILEAQASGVPVVATAVGGIIDIIKDGETGLLVPPQDTEEMAQAIVRLLKDVKLSDSIAGKALDLIKEKFTLSLMAQKTLEVYKEALEEYNILVIKFSAIGDIILSTPAFKAIRKKFPQGRFSLLTSDAGNEILKNCPYIDEILIYDYKNLHKQIGNLFKFGKLLRMKNFDLVVDLQNNRRSHILCFLSSSPKTVGYNNKKFAFLLKTRVKLPKEKMQPVEHQFRLLEGIGIKKEGQDLKLELWPRQKDLEYIEQLLDSNWVSSEQKIVGINVGASWKTKKLSHKQVVKLCDLLASKDIRIILTGDEPEEEFAQSVLEKAASRPVNFCGKTSLNQLACLIKRCKCFITSDSAPLHIAAAMQVPTVAIFGPTDSLRHTPPLRNLAVLNKNLECSPCYKAICKKHTCIEKINVEEIVASVLQLLGEL